VIERLRGTSPRYDSEEIRQARLEALDLFRWLAQETAGRLGYSYPTQLEETVISWVRDQAPECEGGRPTGRPS
jgi:Streptomycin adenylyltransferase